MINILEKSLPKGKENAIHQKELAQFLGVTSATIKIMVKEARQQGVQIISGNGGYWIAKDDLEKKEFVAIMRKKAFTLLESAALINNSIEKTNTATDALNASQGYSKELIY